MESSPSSAGSLGRRPRSLRWVAWVAGGAVVVTAAPVVVALVLLGDLSRPFLKSRIVAAAREQGIDLDFDGGSVSFGHLELTGARIKSPLAYQSLCPDAVTAPRIVADFSPWAALRKGGKVRVTFARVDGATACNATDQDRGESSLALAFGPPAPDAKKAPPKGLSETLATVLPIPVDVEHAEVNVASATSITRSAAVGSQRLQVEALHLSARVVATSLEVKAGGPGVEPLRLALTAADGTSSTAELPYEMALGWGPETSGKLTLAAQAQKATGVLAPLDGRSVAQVDATVVADVTHKRTNVRVSRGEIAKVASFTVEAALLDDVSGQTAPWPVLTEGRGEIAIGKIAAWLGPPQVRVKEEASLRFAATPRPGHLPSVDVEASSFDLDATAPEGKVHLVAPSLAVSVAPADAIWPIEIKPRFTARQLVAEMADGRAVDLRDLKLEGTVVAHSPQKLGDLHFKVDVAHVEATQPGPHPLLASVETVALAIDGASIEMPTEPARWPVAEAKVRLALSDVTTPDAKLQDVALDVGAKSDGNHAVLEPVLLAFANVRAQGKAYGPVAVNVTKATAERGPDGSLASADADVAIETAHGKMHATVKDSPKGTDIVAKGTVPGLAKVLALAGVSKSVPPAVDLSRAGIDIETKAHVTKGNPVRIEHESSGTLRMFSVDVDKKRHSFNAIALAMKGSSQGTAHQYEGTLRLTDPNGAESLVRFKGNADLAAPRGTLTATTEGPALPAVTLEVNGATDRAGNLDVSYKAKADKLTVLTDYIPAETFAGVSLGKLAIESDGTVRLDKAIVRGPGGPRLDARVTSRPAGKAHAQVTATNIDWKRAGQSAAVPRLGFAVDATLGETSVANLSADVTEARYSDRDTEAAVTGAKLASKLEYRTDGAVKAGVTLTLANVEQSRVPFYPAKDVRVEMQVSGNPRATLTLDKLVVDNASGKTHFELSGSAEMQQRRNALFGLDESSLSLVVGRRSLHLKGELRQGLAAFSSSGYGDAQGELSLPFTVESGDLRVFHTGATLELKGASFRATDPPARVDGIDAVIPIDVELLVEKDSRVRLASNGSNAYERLRFSDYHPFLGSGHFFAVRSIQAYGIDLGPIAGNVRIDRDVLALDQMEIAAFGGRITGQLIVEARPEGELVRLRADGTALKIEGDESPFDGNFALNFDTHAMELEGRAEIVRIGKKHLLKLLDVYDPYHAVPSANRARAALAFGYPKRVRLGFHEGFASIEIELGGLGAAISIEAIRGIAIYPVLARYVVPTIEAARKSAGPSAPPIAPAPKP